MTELGRKLHTWQEKMERCHAEIERMVYTAELTCKDYNHVPYCKNEECPFFYLGQDRCSLKRHRNQLGDRVVQHDIPGVERDVSKGI